MFFERREINDFHEGEKTFLKTILIIELSVISKQIESTTPQM